MRSSALSLRLSSFTGGIPKPPAIERNERLDRLGHARGPMPERDTGFKVERIGLTDALAIGAGAELRPKGGEPIQPLESDFHLGDLDLRRADGRRFVVFDAHEPAGLLDLGYLLAVAEGRRMRAAWGLWLHDAREPAIKCERRDYPLRNHICRYLPHRSPPHLAVTVHPSGRSFPRA